MAKNPSERLYTWSDQERYYSDEQVREFLLGWLLEFGQGPITNERMYQSGWYMSRTEDADFIEDFIAYDMSQRKVLIRYITQAGLDFVKGNPNARQ